MIIFLTRAIILYKRPDQKIKNVKNINCISIIWTFLFYVRIARYWYYLSYFDRLRRVNFSRLTTSISVSALIEITKKSAIVRCYLYNYLVSRNASLWNSNGMCNDQKYSNNFNAIPNDQLCIWFKNCRFIYKALKTMV